MHHIHERWVRQALSVGLKAKLEIAEPMPGARYKKRGLISFGYDHTGDGESGTASKSAFVVTEQIGNYVTFPFVRTWPTGTDERVIEMDLVGYGDYFRPDCAVGELRQFEDRRRRVYNLLETKDAEALNFGDIGPRLRELNARELAINRSLTELEAAQPPDVKVSESDLQEVQEFVWDIVLTTNHPERAREFFADFIESIVVSGEAIDVNNRPERLFTVHSEHEWLPDLGSNQGPAD